MRLSGHPGSSFTMPAHAENMMAELISGALKSLLEESYLYRNHRIDIAPIIEAAEDAGNTQGLKRVLERRPWVPWSRNRGFTRDELLQNRMAEGVPTVGVPPEHVKLTVAIPAVKTWCYKCRDSMLHESLPHLEPSPYQRNPEAVAKPLGIQNFIFNMQCQHCKSPPTTLMVRREFLKIQLTGRSHPFVPKVPKEIPEFSKKILEDATRAVACGDLFGGFYHLRTLMEHHMKAELALPIDTDLEGDLLCDRYNKAIDPALAGCCSLTESFAMCAKHLHNRTGEIEDYKRLRKTILNHFRVKQTFPQPL